MQTTSVIYLDSILDHIASSFIFILSYPVYIRYLPRDSNMDHTLWDTMVSDSKVSVNLADTMYLIRQDASYQLFILNE